MAKEIKKRVSTLIQHMSLAEKVGQLFLLGYAGRDTDYAKTLVREFHIGGFYLTEDNAHTPQAAHQLTSELNYEAQLRACDAPLLLAVDQEGSWGVLVEHTTTGPGNLALGAADNTALTEQMHRVLAAEMHTLGFNTILGPCSDINTNPRNPIIGARAFGGEVEKVSRHVVAAVQGLRRGKVISAAKHFPGHGDTGEDSHRLLPSVDKSWPELRATDLAPFQAAVDAGVDMIMTSHILYPQIDPDNPATLSSKILKDILRGKMGFRGLIITDSMNMWAMRKNYTPTEAAVRALNAGADLVMLSEEHYENQLGDYKEKQQQTIAGVIHEVERGQIPEQTIDSALTRVLTFKYRHQALSHPQQLDTSALQSSRHRALAAECARHAIKVVRNRAGRWPLGEHTFTLIGASDPALHPLVTGTRGIGPNEPVAAYSVLKRELEKNACPFTEVPYHLLDTLLDPRHEHPVHKPLVIVTEDYPLPGLDYDADRQAQIVQRAIRKFGDQVVVIALRSDYELDNFPELATYICSYSSRACSARATALALAQVETNETVAATC